VICWYVGYQGELVPTFPGFRRRSGHSGRRWTMDAGTFRFRVGEFECVSVSDGGLNYPLQSLFSNVPLE
jgi:hypothetical protein